MQILFRVIRYLVIFILTVIVFINLYIMYSQVVKSDDYPTIFGIGKVFVNDVHLHSDFQKNDILFTKSSDVYRIGDMVVYETAEEQVRSGKITEITDDGQYHFEDNTDIAVQSYSIKGNVVLTIHNIAPCIEWIESTSGTIVILITILIIFELPHFIYHINQRKSRNKN